MSTNKLLMLVRRLSKLIKEFQLLKQTAPEEFIEEKYETDISDFKLELYNHFLLLMKHKEFLMKVVQNIWNYNNLRLNSEIIMVLVYVIIFILNENNWKNISKMLINLQFKYSLNVIQYFQLEDNVIDTTQAACKFFGSEYVLEKVVNPLSKHGELINQITAYVAEDIQTKTTIVKKPPTIPTSPKFSMKKSHTPKVPPNSLIATGSSRTIKIDKNDYINVNKNLDKAFKENRERTRKLIAFACTHAFNCAKINKRLIEEKASEPYVMKFKKPPPIKEVVVKKNTTSLMREAALVVKHQESEMQKIEALIQGAFDPSVIENLDKEIRQYNEQHNLQEIERKHLQGLLTYEESKFAKQKVVQENKLKMVQFKKEKDEILEQIESWKKHEQEKIKCLVEKCQNIDKAAREAEEKVFRDRRLRAKMIVTETKNILQEAYEKRQRELAEKVKLIQELRALEHLRVLHVKEFDPTETPNFGFLCEMSIAELKERLGLLKVQLREEMERKRNAIADSKRRQQELVDSLRLLVEKNKRINIKPSIKLCSKLELTPEIIALREKLEQLRHCNKVREIQHEILLDP